MKLTIRAADDFHIHLRNDERMPIAASLLRQGGIVRGIVMPNIKPDAVVNGELWQHYKSRLEAEESNFDYLGSISLKPTTPMEVIKEAQSLGVLIGKQYPAGVTTNSEDGVTSIEAMYPVYAEMEKAGLVLSVHGELPNTPVLEAELRFLPILREIANSFPGLKIVMEHISSEAAYETVMDLSDNVAATISPQHLMLTLDDILASNLKPHNYCMPVVKLPSDRKALRKAATSGSPKFFFGSDSAPHLKVNKESNHASPGIFSSPIIMPLIATVFDECDSLDKLENFTSVFGAQFYGLDLNDGIITLTNEVPTKVPAEYDGIVPLKAGSTLPWSICNECN